MGGSVGLTIREPNGKEHRMCRWTNILPWAITNIRLVNKDVKHIEKILDPWYDMREDYMQHKKDGKFRNEMTKVYAPHHYLAPQGYGLVVVDMVNNKILDHQGYISISNIDIISVASDMSSVSPGLHKIMIGDKQPEKLGKKAFYFPDDESRAVRFREFFEDGKIMEARDSRNGNTILLNGKSLEDAIKVIEGDFERYLYFPVNMSPFEVIRYQEFDPEEAKKMKKDILDLGFRLSNEEEAMWDDWVKEGEE